MSKEEIRIRLQHALKHLKHVPAPYPTDVYVAIVETDYILHELDKELEKQNGTVQISVA